MPSWLQPCLGRKISVIRFPKQMTSLTAQEYRSAMHGESRYQENAQGHVCPTLQQRWDEAASQTVLLLYGPAVWPPSL